MIDPLVESKENYTRQEQMLFCEFLWRQAKKEGSLCPIRTQ